jgi:Ser/Thr protein kinase RdoA (MazF antagonist)
MACLFPVTSSILSSEALRAHVGATYGIPAPTGCRFLHRGLNDSYLIRTARSQYIARVYRSGWRAEPDILYELELLLHLDRSGVAVSTPIPQKDGRLIRTVAAPEGDRPLVLFTHVGGRRSSFDEADSHRYGRAVAALHEAMDSFQSEQPRFALDLKHLLLQPLSTLVPRLEHRPQDCDYLRGLADRLRERAAELPLAELEWGACHGDCHGGNAHVDEANRLTFYDFDCCGAGWRAYEVAVFRWNMRLAGKPDGLWEAFLQGYTERRTLSDPDMRGVPLFAAMRQYWFLSLPTVNGDDWGMNVVDWYVDEGLKFLRAWEREELG